MQYDTITYITENRDQVTGAVKSRWLTADRRPSSMAGKPWEGTTEPVYFTKKNGQQARALPVTNAIKYPGYIEWLIDQISAGRTAGLTVTDWRNGDLGR